MEKKAERFSCSLDIDLISQITTESAKRGQSKSYFVAKCIKSGLLINPNVTIAEKYRWKMSILREGLDNLLSSVGLRYTGDIVKTVILIYSLPIEFYDTSFQYDMVKLSIMEILESLNTVDETLFRKVIEILKIQNEKNNSENSEPDMPGRVLLNNTNSVTGSAEGDNDEKSIDINHKRNEIIKKQA